VKTKTISTALQAVNAPVGVHKIAGAAGLYLKIGETAPARTSTATGSATGGARSASAAAIR
jgi:hypothetical protein